MEHGSRRVVMGGRGVSDGWVFFSWVSWSLHGCCASIVYYLGEVELCVCVCVLGSF